MKIKKLRTGTAVFMAGTMFLGSTVFAGTYVPSDSRIFVDGKEMEAEKEKENAVNINGSIYIPLRKVAELFGKEVNWYEDLNEVVIQESKKPDDSAEAFQSDFHLIASIPREDIYVYGLQPKGVIVYYKGQASYLDVEYTTPRMILPAIAYGDYDKDGEKDIALSFYSMSGTGVGIEELHILTADKDKNNASILIDNKLETEAIVSQIQKKLTYQYDRQDKKIELTLDGSKFVCADPAGKNFTTFVTDVSYGSFIEFDLTKSKIMVKVPIATKTNGTVEGNYFGTITAEVSLKGNQFTLSNFGFISDTENEELAELRETAVSLLKNDLEIESIFNAGLQGNADYHYEAYLNFEKTGDPFYPAVSDKYKTMKDIEELMRNTYSSELRINSFLAKGKDYFKEKDGILYVDMKNGGHGMPVIVNFDSVRVEKAGVGKVNITFDYNMFDYDTEPVTTSMSFHSDKWLLDRGIYEFVE